MANGIDISQGKQSGSFTSVVFWVSAPPEFRKANSIPLLGIYGEIGSCLIQLQWQAPDGVWYDCNEPAFDVAAIGLYKLPVNSEVPLRVLYTAGGGSEVGIFVYDGQRKPNASI